MHLYETLQYACTRLRVTTILGTIKEKDMQAISIGNGKDEKDA